MASYLKLNTVLEGPRNDLFKPPGWSPEWFSSWRSYILSLLSDDVIIVPNDKSYDFPKLNLHMRHVLEILAACIKLPPSEHVFDELIKEHIKGIAEACSMDLENTDKLLKNFQIFLCEFTKRHEYTLHSCIESIVLNNDSTSLFRGSLDHLLFGKIVGDALGLHPVFGAMLNPTGGICGPDNSNIFLRALGKIPMMRRHSIVHDASGYLRLYHGVGPGYLYFKTGEIRGRGVPTNGHEHAWQYPWTDMKMLVCWQAGELKDMCRTSSLPELITFFIILSVVILLIIMF
ncbi:Protein of unknown function DUF909 [Oopsacas minuta]|uniref:Uncharacterized protein n=1 Tax=Oopsacas minuta TaxID=111878 RepID=A0AAV7K1R6_9METZ|nr:Protein of unknown function DUF909 [Oopsacas minuta]